MRQAVADIGHAFIGTIHSFCARILRERGRIRAGSGVHGARRSGRQPIPGDLLAGLCRRRACPQRSPAQAPQRNRMDLRNSGISICASASSATSNRTPGMPKPDLKRARGIAPLLRSRQAMLRRAEAAGTSCRPRTGTRGGGSALSATAGPRPDRHPRAVQKCDVVQKRCDRRKRKPSSRSCGGLLCDTVSPAIKACASTSIRIACIRRAGANSRRTARRRFDTRLHGPPDQST